MVGPTDLVRFALRTTLDRVVQLNQGPVDAWIRKARLSAPGAPPAQVLQVLEKQYRRTVVGLGAASGAAAAAPGLSTGLGLASAPAEVALFLEATALYAHAVAEVHGVHLDDPERKRLLVLAVALGEPGTRVVEKALGRKGGYWGRQLVQGLPLSSVREVNVTLVKDFVTRYSRKQGMLVIGRAVPLGVGAAIGAAGNAALARASIAATRRAFGPAPASFTHPVQRAPRAPRAPRGRRDVVDGEVVAQGPRLTG